MENGLKRAPLTHPDCATLVDPLFACGGKRVKKCSIYYLSNRLRLTPISSPRNSARPFNLPMAE